MRHHSNQWLALGKRRPPLPREEALAGGQLTVEEIKPEPITDLPLCDAFFYCPSVASQIVTFKQFHAIMERTGGTIIVKRRVYALRSCRFGGKMVRVWAVDEESKTVKKPQAKQEGV